MTLHTSSVCRVAPDGVAVANPVFDVTPARYITAIITERGVVHPSRHQSVETLLQGKPVEFYSCFISYSSVDQAFAERLHADLEGRGVTCWFAPRDLWGGTNSGTDSAREIREYFIPDFSNWVEVRSARRMARRPTRPVARRRGCC